MRIVPFPGRGEEPLEAWQHELELVLAGEIVTVEGESWVQLREDVRTLAPPMSPDFERRMQGRIEEWAAAAAAAAPAPAPAHARGRRRWRSSRGMRGASVAAAAAALAGAIAIVTTSDRGTGVVTPPARKGATVQARTQSGAVQSGAVQSGAARAALAPALPSGGAPSAQAGAGAPGREQQLSASITLASSPSEVQSTADRVARLAVSDGGFVASSQVQQQQEGSSEASLQLSLPSARLAAALSSLGRLAPVHAESQSLQDITSSYDAARRTLADAVAERSALLRALSRASTQGEIDSLREQLSLAGGAISRARAAFATVSARAADATVEVTVVGDAHPTTEGLTLRHGLRLAGRVLTVALIVLLVGAAVLVPLALLASGLLLGARRWRRHLREQALEQP
jgi:hypothetical protein